MIKHYAKIKSLFDWACGLVLIASLVVSLKVSNTTKEIVHEVEHYHETIVKHASETKIKYLHDTVYIKVPEPVTIERKETVYFSMIYNPNTENTTILSNEEVDNLRKHRKDFLERNEQMKAQQAK